MVEEAGLVAVAAAAAGPPEVDGAVAVVAGGALEVAGGGIVEGDDNVRTLFHTLNATFVYTQHKYRHAHTPNQPTKYYTNTTITTYDHHRL